MQPPATFSADAMNAAENIAVLNRLLQVLCRSLAAYLSDATSWARPESRRMRVAVEHLVSDQQGYAQQVAEAVEAIGGRAHPGRFPLEFAAKNDLSLEYLVDEIIDDQEQSVVVIEHCAVLLEGAPSLHALAEEILGNAKGHLDILKDLRSSI